MTTTLAEGASEGDQLDLKVATFRRRLLKQSAAVVSVGTALLIVASLALLPFTIYFIALGATLCLSVVTLVLAESDSERAVPLLVYGGSAVNAGLILIDPSAPWLVSLIELALLLIVGALLLRPQACKIVGGLDALVTAIVIARAVVIGGQSDEQVLVGVACLLLFPLIFSVVPLYSQEAFENVKALHKRLLHMEQLAAELDGATNHLSAATTQISTMSQRHLAGAVQQSSAVKEIRATLHSVTGSSRKITKSAHHVFANADQTLANNERVTDRITELSELVENIGGVLKQISDIAAKSQVLALNAALEGTKAGEAGRSFSIVAKQMQQLAENVQRSVADINKLTKEIKTATRATALAMGDATELARATTDAAREISLVSQQQQSSTEQVANAMNDIGEITSQVSDGSEQTKASTEDLADLTYRLRQLVGKLVITSG